VQCQQLAAGVSVLPLKVTLLILFSDTKIPYKKTQKQHFFALKLQILVCKRNNVLHYTKMKMMKRMNWRIFI